MPDLQLVWHHTAWTLSPQIQIRLCLQFMSQLWLLQALNSATHAVSAANGIANGTGLLQSALQSAAPRVAAAMRQGPFGIGQATAGPAAPQTIS